MSATDARKGWMSVFLNTVERGGNALPHPATLFAIFAFLILVVSALASWSGILWGTVPASGFLRDPETGSLLRSPFMSGIVAFIFLAGIIIGGRTASAPERSKTTPTS